MTHKLFQSFDFNTYEIDGGGGGDVSSGSSCRENN